ncbi:MAG TPA: hypothetical protein ENK65_01690 [Helicobacteraceae bacterium]|nr:hypothetical protein [Helicobacteraceae bacterium]
MPKVEVLVVALGSPFLVGIYEEGRLIREIREDRRVSDALASIFETLQASYTITSLYYAKGPGSFMSIKLSYIFLRSYAIINAIVLKSVDAFYFNQSQPIKAVGKLVFVKNADTITMQRYDDTMNIGMNFTLPNYLKPEDYSSDNEPYYGIDAV